MANLDKYKRRTDGPNPNRRIWTLEESVEETLGIIETTGDGTKFLSNDGTYRSLLTAGYITASSTNTLTNKTIDGTVNSITNISGANIVANSIPNSALVNVATSTLRGRVAAGSGSVENLTPLQVRTLINVEDGADVTDATNVDAAGATMNTDTTLVGNGYFLDEDNMASDDDTKVASQQSIKAYVDSSLVSKVDTTITTNRQVISYQLVLSDASKLVEMNLAGANNLTVPPNSTVAFPTGTQILIAQYGAGQTTVVAGGGVTINSAGGALKLANQYSGATLVKIGTDEWYLFGDITT